VIGEAEINQGDNGKMMAKPAAYGAEGKMGRYLNFCLFQTLNLPSKE